MAVAQSELRVPTRLLAIFALLGASYLAGRQLLSNPQVRLNPGLPSSPDDVIDGIGNDLPSISEIHPINLPDRTDLTNMALAELL